MRFTLLVLIKHEELQVARDQSEPFIGIISVMMIKYTIDD